MKRREPLPPPAASPSPPAASPSPPAGPAPPSGSVRSEPPLSAPRLVNTFRAADTSRALLAANRPSTVIQTVLVNRSRISEMDCSQGTQGGPLSPLPQPEDEFPFPAQTYQRLSIFESGLKPRPHTHTQPHTHTHTHTHTHGQTKTHLRCGCTG